MLVVIRGAGDIATGIAVRLRRAGMRVVMCDLPVPTAVRRTVAFSEAIRLGEAEVEGVRARLAATPAEARAIAGAGDVAVLVDPEAACVAELAPDAVVDAILAKRNLGTDRSLAPAVVGVGPGFTAGAGADADCHAVVETQRGHDLGRAIYEGSAAPNTGVPGDIGGYTVERVLRAGAVGAFEPVCSIGEVVHAGDAVAYVAGVPVETAIDGVLRGLLQEGVPVAPGFKVGDVDPRCAPAHCRTVSDKARAVAGGVLEAILHVLGGAERVGIDGGPLRARGAR